MRSRALVFGLVAGLGLAALVAPLLRAQAGDAGWPMHGGVDNIRHSPLTEINRSNVGRLQVAWTYDSGDAFNGSEMQSHPVIVDGAMYLTTPTLKVVSLDAKTGKELWRFDPSGGNSRGRFRHRGVTVHEDRVFVTYRSFLWAIDRKTGKAIESFGKAGRVDLREGFGRPVERVSVSASTPGAIFEDLLILGSSVPETLPGTPGHIRAFDVNTGAIRWTFHTIPQPGELGYESWPNGAHQISGGANAWAGVVVDAKMGAVFAATGSASFDFYGSSRHGDNLFANCVLALDARTGKRLWHFQAVKHDMWDWDFPASPNLVTVTRDGRKVEAVAQVTKYGYTFVLDRRTGAPLFPIEYRRAMESDVDGEKAAATQVHPLKPPPFTRQQFTEDIVTRRTPEAHAAVLAQVRKWRSGGLFTPPSREGTIIFPGVDGGAEWGGAAFDPETALLYVNSNEMPWVVRLIPNSDTAVYNAMCATCHRENRQGSPAAPSLVDIGKRLSRDDIGKIIREGTGRMPGFPDMGGKNIEDVTDFLLTGKDKAADPSFTKDPNYLKYRVDGYLLLRDPDGYPPITPPWGTLNAIDLNAGTIRWKIPFGEYPELAAKGLKDTGSDNYGGPLVTAGGLLFIGATEFDKKFHAYDKLTGKLLWETVLPFAGNATPSTYTIGGRQFVVIVCGGGKNGAPSGSSVVAFALPEP